MEDQILTQEQVIQRIEEIKHQTNDSDKIWEIRSLGYALKELGEEMMKKASTGLFRFAE